MQVRKPTNRRDFLRLSALGAGAMLVAACSAPAASPTAAPAAKATTAPAAAATTAPAAAATTAPAAAATTAPAAAATTAPAAAAATKPAEATKPAAATTAPASAATTAPAAAASNLTGKLEIFSWWTSGGEVEALNALYDIFKKENPKVEIVNSALTGGTSSGGNMKAVLQTRLMGGDPPESFQIHLGEELNADHVVAGRMEPLDTFYKDEGYDKVFPKQLLDLADFQGKPWAVPVNIHRTNVMWYSKKAFTDAGITAPPKTWEEWLTNAEKLKGKGIAALGISEASPGQVAQLFESMLMGTDFFGAEGYNGLFTGQTSWSDPKFKTGLELLLKMEPYFNKDYLSVQWSDMIDLIVSGKAASMINGDWTPGVFWSKNYKEFGWADTPQATGVYAITSDAFGLPKGVKNANNAKAWLKVCGSKVGQENFNLLKGSIPVRTDCDTSKFTEYHKDAIKLWTSSTVKITPSIVHGVAAKPSFNVDFQTALNVFIAKKDVAACQAALVKAAKDAGFKA